MTKKKQKKKSLESQENNGATRNPLAWIVGISTEHPGKTLLAFLIITLIFMIPMSRFQVDTSMEGVFGNEDQPEEIEIFEEIGSEFGEQEDILIVIDCKEQKNGDIAKSYLTALSAKLEKEDDFKNIKYTVNFEIPVQKAILYLDKESLGELKELNMTIEKFASKQMAANSELQYLVSEDGKIYLLSMVLNVTITSADQRMAIFDGLYDTLDDVKGDNSTYKVLDVGFTGGVMVLDYEGDKMAMNDFIVTFFITFILILILLFVSFRSLSLPAFALVPLVVGIIITSGITILIFGALNMLAAFFAVLLLGLGIDFSIHILSRFTEEMEIENDVKKAFRKTSINTGKAVVLGTLTTAVAFGALIFSKTYGMHQMGFVLAVGLIVTMVCVLFMLPALVTLRLRHGKLKEKLHKRAKYEVLGRLGTSVTKAAPVLVVILIIFGAFIVIETQNLKVNDDITELLPTEVPSYKQLEKVKDAFNYTEDNLMCIADGETELVSSVESFRANPEIMQVESVLDRLPSDQEEKLVIISEAIEIHPEFENITWLNITEVLSWEELPNEMTKDWVSHNGGEPRFLIVLKARGNVWNDDYRTDLLEELEDVNPNIAGRAIAYTKMIEVITEDVVWVSIFAIVPIVIIVYAGFKTRSPVYAVLALVPVLVGVGSILALSEYFGLDLNMISIMMIPMVIGIGIDDGIHILHRYQEEGPGSIPKVVQNTGKAVFLTTATTCLAFSSFLVAEHPGMRPMGGVPVFGLIMAFIAAIIFLPALISLILDRQKVKEEA